MVELLLCREALPAQEDLIVVNKDEFTRVALSEANRNTFGQARAAVITIGIEHAMEGMYLAAPQWQPEVLALYEDMAERITSCLEDVCLPLT